MSRLHDHLTGKVKEEQKKTFKQIQDEKEKELYEKMFRTPGKVLRQGVKK